jgi:hypothetical protein
MPYVPGCRYDLFISYASENNQDGWVEQFERALGRELGELLGRQFNPKESVYFEKRELEVAQNFQEEIDRAAQDSAILVPILSPGYLTSPWCDRERQEFFKKVPHGADAANCIAPILLRPIEPALAPYRHTQRLSFLSSDNQTPLVPGSPDWTSQVRTFAGQLKIALHKLRQHYNPVFLGKAAKTERLQKLRAWCRSELERRHFRTVPESLPALDDPDAVRATLQDAGLAVHFLGGADTSAIEAIETSIAVCAGPTILFQPFGTVLTPDELLGLGYLERELIPKPGRYQRLAGKNDQELLALIDEQITRVRGDSGTGVVRPDLALVCEEPDMKSIRKLIEDIRAKHPVEVHSPDFLSSRMRAMEKLRKWEDYLSRSEALLFYYGLTERERLEIILQKAQNQKPDARCDWFLAPPDLDSKRHKHPDAMWNIDQVIGFVERIRDAQQL